MPNIQTEFYKTKDLAEASMLVVKKQKMTSIERMDRICWFVFSNKSECEILSHEYFYGEVLVDALEFHEVMKRLKNRIFSGE